MTPREKAEELLHKLYIPDYCYAKAGMDSNWRRKASKRNALIAVDLVLEYEDMPSGNKKYWQEVKTQIENL